MSVEDDDVAVVELRKTFFFPIAEEKLFELFDQVREKLPPAHQEIAAAFRHNLVAASDVLSLPFHLAHVSVFRRDLRDYVADAIEDVEAAGVAEADKDKAVEVRIEELMQAAEERDKHGDRIAPAVFEEMMAVFRYSDGHARTTQELLRQGVVLVWGALEVLVLDCYRLWCGKEADPKKALNEMIPHYGSGKAFLKDLELWELYNRRHLIVHRLGIVDEKYVKETGSKLPIGSEIMVTPLELEDNFDTAVVTAMSILLMSCKPPVDNSP